MIIPDVYYFNTIEEVDLTQIKADSVVLIGKESYEKFGETQYRTTAYFVKNQQFVLEHETKKSALLELSNDQWEEVNHRDTSSGKIDFIEEPYWENMSLYGQIRGLISEVDFPYASVVVYLSKDAKSIELKKYKPTFSTINKEDDANNIHPILKEFMLAKNAPDYHLLTLLYKLKQSPDIHQSVNFYQSGGYRVGLGLTKGRARPVSIDHMIAEVRRACGFKNIAEFQAEINKVTNQFKNSKLTQQQTAILNDFVSFFNANISNPSMISPRMMIEEWVKSYMEINTENPFVILNQHRRTGALSIFNPKLPSTITIFNKVIDNEQISTLLEEIMPGQKNTI